MSANIPGWVKQVGRDVAANRVGGTADAGVVCAPSIKLISRVVHILDCLEIDDVPWMPEVTCGFITSQVDPHDAGDQRHQFADIKWAFNGRWVRLHIEHHQSEVVDALTGKPVYVRGYEFVGVNSAYAAVVASEAKQSLTIDNIRRNLCWLYTTLEERLSRGTNV